ncbi:MAG: CHRD domain-containing protein [Acidobacteriia bacterium]|nr:CHRD domain-containing protein [Terriglobia bacterium]
MKMNRIAMAALLLAGMVTAAPAADTTETYKARLSAVAADARTRPELAGLGSATAVLSGSKLTVTGSFDGLRSPATMAQLHSAVAAGVRGPVIQDLTVAKALSGMISGSVDLTPPQIEALRKGGLYIQIHSEKAPDGVLWGWLLR